MKKNATPLKEGDARQPVKKSPELKTEPPISEKDEVKKAEVKTAKSAGKHL